MLTLLSSKRHPTASYRAALDGAQALATSTGQAVYAFKCMETTLHPPVWCYSFHVPACGAIGKVHRVDAVA
jgi:hypothetical protein